jgi:hypothetical protein
MENPTVTIEFSRDNHAVKVNWNGEVQTLEFVLAMIEMAKIATTDQRNAQRIQQLQNGIQPAPDTRAFLSGLSMAGRKM